MRSVQSAIEPDAVQHDQFKDNPSMEMPVKTIKGHAYIGYLKIEALGLELPVLNQWSYPLIRVSPARYQGSIYEHNMVILAHNYRAHFGGLHRLESGDTIEFTDMADNTFQYKVRKVEEISGDNPDALLSEKADLTLFTCTLGGKSRVVVHCEGI